MEEGGAPHEAGSEIDVEGERPTIPFGVLELDYVFRGIAHPRRRYLLYTLLEGTRWSLRELATKVAAWENDVPEETVREDERGRVYASLYHAHVPRLVDDGILEFNEQKEVITAGEHADQVLAVLEGAAANIDVRQESHARKEYHE